MSVDGGRILAHVKVRGDFERFVRADSTATIKKVFGVAGDSFIEITRGTGEPLPAQNAPIPCQSTEELRRRMEKTLTELREELLPVVKKAGTTLDVWAGAGQGFEANAGAVDQLVSRLDGLAAGVEQGKGTAGKLLTDTALVDDGAGLLATANRHMTSCKAS